MDFIDYMIFVCFSAVGLGVLFGIAFAIFNGVFFILEKMGYGDKYEIIEKMLKSRGYED